MYTYYVDMNVTLALDGDVVREARRRAEAMGVTVNQLIREYLENFAGKSDREEVVREFRRLSENPQGDSRGWKFNREELHERRLAVWQPSTRTSSCTRRTKRPQQNEVGGRSFCGI